MIFRPLCFAVVFASFACGLSGCSNKDVGSAPTATPGATYTGPRYLYNSVGSLASLQNRDPLLVTGYGVVVGLDGTGTSEVPAFLRQWLLNEITKRGVGREIYEEEFPLSPAQLLASRNTAVVRVWGIIPAGAVAGSRFDLMVEAADTSTTSLVGGRLWTTELSQGGLDPGRTYTTPLAEGKGPIYLGPSDEESDSQFELDDYQRQALIVAGGEVDKTRAFELVLNQPSRSRAALIADRINERFPAAPSDDRPTANAISPLVIQLNIPERFAGEPRLFVDLVRHTFVDRSFGFVPFKTRELLKDLIEDPSRSSSIVMAWKALGPNAAIVLREYYAVDESLPAEEQVPLYVRLAALEAGAYVGDERASESLLELAGHEEPSVRTRVAQALVNLPKSIYGTRALRTLLDDPVRSVRIAAYESLARTGSPLVERTVMRERDGEIKLVIDRLPVREPLIYITQKQYPRLVIFNPRLGFDAPTLAGIWDDRLMIRRQEAGEPAEFFFQYRDRKQKNKIVTKQHKIDPTVATLAYILAHRSTLEEPQAGYDLTYGEVADAVYELARAGAIDTEIEVDRSQMARLLDRTREGRPAPGPSRPETAPATSDLGSGPAGVSTADAATPR
ncbi:MAG: flagellar basal body P-ring protein FlgI [Planctomycetota bacterium]